MEILSADGDDWRLLTHARRDQQIEQANSRWSEFKKRLAFGPAKQHLSLRGIALILAQFPCAEAYNTAVLLYRRSVLAHLKGKPDHGRLVARLPLHPLFRAPALSDSFLPILCRQTNHQAYLKPDFFSTSEERKKLLFGVTSRTHTLSMPLLAFHAYAQRHYDGIVYFFDPDRNYYQGKQQSLIRLVQNFLRLRPYNSTKLSFIGTSAGACTAIKLALSQDYARVIAGSPVLNIEHILYNFLQGTYADLERIRFTWGRNRVDSAYSDFFERITFPAPGKAMAHDVSDLSPSHGSIGIASLSGLLDTLLTWAAETPNETD